ncbi:MAG: hypothetical protein KH842_01750 [Firmicutes bacterium]|nr:hypothetical protein [Bacillota bacterium]
MRETQEGCPSPLKSIVFEAFSEFQKLSQRGKKLFRHADDKEKIRLIATFERIDP